jgi:catechol 2,3-dioxygenase-like lactoylglutathione lyase family enzyme
MGRGVKTDHIAFVTGDTEATVDFYTRVMRWPLVGTHQGTEPDGRKFFMTAFAADAYCIEFEEIEDRPAPPTFAIGFPHFGIDLGTYAEYDEWKAHLEEREVDYLEMMRGDLFITDPNGVSFQFIVKQSADNDTTDADRVARAEQMVKEWIEARRAANASPATA